MNYNTSYWSVCLKCNGRGKKRKRPSKKAVYNYQKQVTAYKANNKETEIPQPPKGILSVCASCKGAGIVLSEKPLIHINKAYPHIAIVGAGIGGVALAVACLHRGIPFTLFERDVSFNARSQGYGLTLQQASKAIASFGITSLKEGIVSTKHVVHTPEGEIIGEWGMRKWMASTSEKKNKQTNIHIARQSLRSAFLNQLDSYDVIKWGYQFLGFENTKEGTVQLKFKVDETVKYVTADLLVGADGIRSTVRNLLIGEKQTPLQYLDCIVILGICSLEALKTINTDLLDGETVFQTANGNERIYMMPYSKDAIMWQLSFPMKEEAAKALSKKGAKALKEEACSRVPWHSPIPEILKATQEELITGYPVYDRALLSPEFLEKETAVTLLGDAAHPMSPFKGQGANQALLDALSLAQSIYLGCKEFSNWRTKGIRKSALSAFEREMLARTASKVKGSAEAAKFLHSEIALHKGNQPRGSAFKKNKKE